MTGYNLPPGCNVNDIPGNTSWDDKYDIWITKVLELCEDKGIEADDDLPYESWFFDGLSPERAVVQVENWGLLK